MLKLQFQMCKFGAFTLLLGRYEERPAKRLSDEVPACGEVQMNGIWSS